MTSRRTCLAALGLALALAGCTQGGATPPRVDRAGHVSASTSPSAAVPTEPTPSPAPSRSAQGPRSERYTVDTGWGPTRREVRRARRIVSRMPLKRLAGQVIVAHYGGLDAPSALVNGLHLGGVIVMGENVRGTAQVRRSNTALQAAAREAGRRWPVFIGVDQEGGVVERVKGRATRFPSFMTSGAALDRSVVRDAAAASGAELVGLGFSVVFAPVADVTSGPSDPTIGSRSPGSDPALVASRMNLAVDGYLAAGILPVVKHFPGHGSVPADSHVEMPVQEKRLGRLRRTDLVPFEAAVVRGASAVMVAHIDVRAVDPGVPASLSRRVVTGLLRRDLGYDGLVVTDALNMGAVTERYSSGAAAVRALRAGNDVLLMPADPRAARDGVVRAVRAGRLSRSRLEQAAARQIAMLLHQHRLDPALTRRPGDSLRESRRLSAAAATVVSGPCRGRLVGSSVVATGPDEAVRRFDRAARRAGLGTGSGTHVALIGYGGSAASADVVVSLDLPYVLGVSTARTARIAMYGDTPGAMRALVDVLTGRSGAPGRLPVHVDGVPRRGCGA
jgi:beta-N-acetylhexosaminidase